MYNVGDKVKFINCSDKPNAVIFAKGLGLVENEIYTVTSVGSYSGIQVLYVDDIDAPFITDIFESITKQPSHVDMINALIDGLDYKGEISDGSHTFDELYYHRMILFSVICNQNKDKAWKSLLHHDDTMYEDYFIVGITIDGVGQFSYHYHLRYWDMFKCKEYKRAPEWDGHTSQDVIRLLSL